MMMIIKISTVIAFVALILFIPFFFAKDVDKILIHAYYQTGKLDLFLTFK